MGDQMKIKIKMMGKCGVRGLLNLNLAPSTGAYRRSADVLGV